MMTSINKPITFETQGENLCVDSQCLEDSEPHVGFDINVNHNIPSFRSLLFGKSIPASDGKSDKERDQSQDQEDFNNRFKDSFAHMLNYGIIDSLLANIQPIAKTMGVDLVSDNTGSCWLFAAVLVCVQVRYCTSKALNSILLCTYFLVLLPAGSKWASNKVNSLTNDLLREAGRPADDSMKEYVDFVYNSQYGIDHMRLVGMISNGTIDKNFFHTVIEYIENNYEKEKDVNQSSILSSMKDYVFSLFNDMDNTSISTDDIDMEEILLEEQIGVDLFAKIGPLLTGLLSAGLNHSVRPDFAKTMLEMTKISPTQTANVTSLLMHSCTALHSFLEKIGTPKEFSKYFYVDQIDSCAVRSFEARFLSFKADVTVGKFPDHSLIYEFAQRLKNDALGLIKITPDKYSYDYKVLERGLKDIGDLLLSAQISQRTQSGPRPEPVGILFTGEAGIAKTELSKKICDMLLDTISPECCRDNYGEIINREQLVFDMPTDKFWDGYSSSTIIIKGDDIFSARETATMQDPDSLKIINMINTNPWPVPIAECTEKNKVFCRAKVFLGTSNLKNLDLLESVNDKRAVKRRFHFTVDTKVNSDYLDSSGKVDPMRLPHGTDGITYFPDDYWVCTVVEHKSNCHSEPIELYYHQLIEYIIKRIKQHEKFYKMNEIANRNSVLKYRLRNREIYNTFQDGFDEFKHSMYRIDMTNAKICKYVNFVTGLSREGLDKFLNDWIDFLDTDCCGLDTKPLKWKGLSALESLVTEFPDNYNPNMILYYCKIVLFARHLNRRDLLTGDPLLEERKYVIPDFKEKISQFFSFLQNNWKSIVACLLAGGVLYVIVKKFFTIQKDVNNFLGAKEPEEQVGFLEKNFNVKVPSPLFGVRNNVNDALSKSINSYSFYMSLKDPDGELVSLGMTHNYSGRMFICNRHFKLMLEHYTQRDSRYLDCNLTLTTLYGNKQHVLPVREFIRFDVEDSLKAKDILIYYLDSVPITSSGIRRYIATSFDYNKIMSRTRFSARVLFYVNNELRDLPTIVDSQVTAFSPKVPIIVKSKTGLEYNIPNGFTYTGSVFKKGYCGGLLIVPDLSTDNRFICGFHAAGTEVVGHSTSITQELLDPYVDSVGGVMCPYYKEREVLGVVSAPPELQGWAQPIGSMDSSHQIVTLAQSDITKSVLHSRIPSYGNSIMSCTKLKKFTHEDGRIIDPNENALKNYGFKNKFVPNYQLNLAGSLYSDLIERNSIIARGFRTKKDLRESLYAFGTVKRIDPNTSAGYPYNLPNAYNPKKEWVLACRSGDPKRKYDTESKIVDICLSKLSEIVKGIRPEDFVYSGNLKDEKIKKHKSREGLTRFFAGANFIQHNINRAYFGDFIDNFTQMNISVGSAIGVNPYSNRWDDLAKLMNQFDGDNLNKCNKGAGDYSKFDGHQMTNIQNKIIEIINEWYGDEGYTSLDGQEVPDNVIRMRLFMEICNARIILDNKCYEWQTALPSGNTLTALVNTMYNNMLLRLVWIRVGINPMDFDKHFYMCSLGDDIIFSISDRYRHLINEITLPSLMDELGMVYTNETKGTSEVEFRTITEIEFLKRSFRFLPCKNRWVAPLRKESYYESIYWTKKDPMLKDVITIDNVRNGLREATLWGKPDFEQFYNEVIPLVDAYLPHVSLSGGGSFTKHYDLSLEEALSSDYAYNF